MNITKELIKLLLDNMISTYQEADDDRFHINQSEKNGTLPYSILGELEMLSGNIAGIESHCKKEMFEKAKWAVSILEENSIFNHAHVNDWIEKEAKKHKKYFEHIQAIEFLRVALLCYIKSKFGK